MVRWAPQSRSARPVAAKLACDRRPGRSFLMIPDAGSARNERSLPAQPAEEAAPAMLGTALPFVLRLLRLEPRVAAGPIALAWADVITILNLVC